MFYFLFFLCLIWVESITNLLQYCTVDRVSWVPRLALLDFRTNWPSQTRSWNTTCCWVGGLLFCAWSLTAKVKGTRLGRFHHTHLPPQPGPGVCVSHPGMRACEASSDSCPTSTQPWQRGCSHQAVCMHAAHLRQLRHLGWPRPAGARDSRPLPCGPLLRAPGHTGCQQPGGSLCPFPGCPDTPCPRTRRRALSLQDGGQHSWGRAGRRRCPNSQNQWVAREVKHLRYHHEEKIFFPVIRTLRIYSLYGFQIHQTATLTIIIMLYIRSPELIPPT